MDIHSNFSATRASGASPTRRSPPAFEALLDKASLPQSPILQQSLQNAPDSRPEAVALARKLIADPDFPSEQAQQILAHHLAVQLTAETDPLP
jgi:hypothetical protein